MKAFSRLAMAAPCYGHCVFLVATWAVVSEANSLLQVQTRGEQTVTSRSADRGVLCQTLLHPAIHSAHFLRFAASAIGDDLAARFDSEFRSECRDHFAPATWLHLWDNYTGSWEQEEVADHDNEIFGSLGAWLNTERERTHTATKTWKQFAKPDDGKSTMRILERIASHPTSISVELDRVLDFGCGDGLDLAAVARGFDLSRTDAFCLDVGAPRLDPEAEEGVTFLPLDNQSPEAYAKSLAGHLADGVAGSVAVAYSFVVLHHVADTDMRASALCFLRDALKPGGILVVAEWDNPGTPVDFSVYFDLVHDLPALLLGQHAATHYTLKPHGTLYESRSTLIAEMESWGLVYDDRRSETPSKATDGSGVVWRGSQWMADHSVNRNYMAVFTSVPQSARLLPFRHQTGVPPRRSPVGNRHERDTGNASSADTPMQYW